MSADLLREAAAKMRERAEAARDNDECGQSWVAAPSLDPDNNGWLVAYEPQVDGFDDLIATVPYDYEGKLARHLSGWHPAVALAVADWLEESADHLEAGVGVPDDLLPHVCPTALEGLECSVLVQSLAVARAYLNTPTKEHTS